MTKKRDKIELNSREYQDILSKPPHWILKTGAMILLGLIILLFVLSAVFKYPEIVRAEIKIVQENIRETVLASQSGVIDSLYEQDQSIVSAGQKIVEIRDGRNHSSYVYASSSGILRYYKLWKGNDRIKEKEKLFYIDPEEEPITYGIITIPFSDKSRRIKTGMTVSISLDAYPSDKYGKLNGEVKDISYVPGDSLMHLMINLDSSLVSDRGQILELPAKSRGQAHIVLKKKTLLKAFMEHLALF